MEGILGDSGLKSAVKDFVHSQTEDVIELELFSGKETISIHSSEEGSTFKQSSRILVLEGKKLTSSFSELGKGEMASPYLSLILEAVLANELEFVVNPFLLVGPSRGLECG